MIDRDIKRCLGQMIKGIEVVGARHDGVARAYTSHWVTQVSFEEPIVMASVSPKHDTYPLMVATTLAASMAFMLPVATPPNAIVFGSRLIPASAMARAGMWLNVAAIAVITLTVTLLA